MIAPGLNEATVLLNQQRDRSDLPDCVTYSKEKFYKENNPDHPEDIVDRTQGQSIYLYLDLHGHKGQSVRVVFDSGATVSLWLEQTIRDGLLTTWIDRDSPAAIAGIGNNTTRAVTCTVRLPGNIKNKHTGNYIDYYCKSTMVEQIIPPLKPSNQTQLITEVLKCLKKDRTIPADMIPNNFQAELGGQLQGLIGAKHLSEFPVAVMHFSNGLSVYKHTLRPAGNRNRVYCLGGSLPAMNAFKTNHGANVTDIFNAMLYDSCAAQAILFDGEMIDPGLRTIGRLEDMTFRDQQGEDDCAELQKSSLASGLATNTASESQLDFHAHASVKKPS